MSNKKFVGEIERLFVNDRKTAYGDKKSISIANNKVYYGLGLHDSPVYLVDGVELQEGMTVSFEYTDGKYKNVVLETLKIVQQEKPKEAKKVNNDKDLPIRLGNAITISSHFAKNVSEVSVIAQQVLPMMDTLRDKLAAKHTDLSDFAIGARVGQSGILAAQFTKDINSFIGVAEQLFEDICNVENYLKNGNVITEQPKQEVKVEEKQPETISTPAGMDFDDDIPFAPIGLQYPQLLLVM